MGKPNRNRKNRCSCRSQRSKQSSKQCSKCQKKGKTGPLQSCATTLDKSASTSRRQLQKQTFSRGGKMDSKHFSSRSTTDNLPSSLSTPGERAGLSSTSPAASVESTSVVTSSTSPNTMSPHLSTACGTSGPADITSHSTNPTPTTDTEVEARLPPPPDVTESESTHSSTSDKSYDPKNDPNICLSSSSSSSSCSNLPSTLSAVISSSSSKGHNNKDDLLNSDFHQGNGLSCSTTDSLSLSPTAKNNSITSSSNTIISNGQNNAVDTSTSSNVGNNATNTITSSNSNIKDNNIVSAIEKGEDQSKEGLSSSTSSPNTKSLPATGIQPGVSLTKESKTSIEVSSQTSPSARGVKRPHEDVEAISESSNSPKPSPQKNKKRCFTCSCRLELAQRTIGKCRCDHVFCPMHRLPELHDCEFNHKEDGRREAREKMVKPTRHMGTSFRRDDRT